MLDSIQNSLEIIANFLYIIMHPRIIFRIIFDWIVSISYWVTVFISITSLLFFISTKSKKSKQILSGSILAYILLKAVASVI